MHPNLERRFVELEVARGMLAMRLFTFAGAFQYLFRALAADMKISERELGGKMGWEPIPDGGNAIMQGKAEPSREDCYRLLGIYLSLPRPEEPLGVPRCDRCGWPLVADMKDGCTVGNCSMRGGIA